MGNSRVTHFEACPKCRENGGDQSGDNLAVYDDGHTNCFACGHQDQPSGYTMQEKKTITLPQSAPFPKGGWKKKGIDEKTLERFSIVRVAKLDAEGCPVYERYEDGSFTVVGGTALAFPYFDIDTGELAAFKTRDLAIESKKEAMRWVNHNERVSLFGVSAAPAGATTAILVEGESDALSVAQALPDAAVYGVSGAASVKQAIQRTAHVLRKFRKVIIGFDNDEAGAKYTAEAIPMLPKGKAWVTNIPAKYKDWNEVLLAGGTEAVKVIVRNATQVKSSNLMTSDELFKTAWEQLANRDKGTIGYTTGYPTLDAAIGGLAPGKLITIVSGTGAGKSLLCEQIVTNAITKHEDLTALFVPLEMTNSQVLERMTQSMTGLPLAADPFFHMHMEPEEERLAKATMKLLAERVVFPRQDKTIDVAHFVELLEEAVEVHDARLIVLDHITALSVNEKDGLDWKAIDRTMAKLKELAVRLNVCVVTVSHISRDGDNEEEVPKLKHIRAGNGIAQYSDCVLGMGRKRSENKAVVETIKLDRMIGKWVQFTVSYKNFKLVQDAQLEDGNGHDAIPGSQAGELRQQTRERSSPDVPHVGASPGTSDSMEEFSQVSPGLCDTERGIPRDEGVYDTERQNKVVRGDKTKPIDRLKSVVFFTPTETELIKQDDLR